MKLENSLFALELDLDMIAFKMDLIIEDLEEELDLIVEQDKDPEKTIKALATLVATKTGLIKLASQEINELRRENK